MDSRSTNRAHFSKKKVLQKLVHPSDTIFRDFSSQFCAAACIKLNIEACEKMIDAAMLSRMFHNVPEAQIVLNFQKKKVLQTLVHPSDTIFRDFSAQFCAAACIKLNIEACEKNIDAAMLSFRTCFYLSIHFCYSFFFLSFLFPFFFFFMFFF